MYIAILGVLVYTIDVQVYSIEICLFYQISEISTFVKEMTVNALWRSCNCVIIFYFIPFLKEITTPKTEMNLKIFDISIILNHYKGTIR